MRASRSQPFSLLFSFLPPLFQRRRCLTQEMPVDTTSSSSSLSQRRHVGNANVTTMHVVISTVIVSHCRGRLLPRVVQESAAPPRLDGQRPASHLRNHLISLTVGIFDTAVQIPRPRVQHRAATWRHTIGARAYHRGVGTLFRVQSNRRVCDAKANWYIFHRRDNAIARNSAERPVKSSNLVVCFPPWCFIGESHVEE